ncbi:metallophosphoesterase family protein [Paenibacillus sp. y28]|uniref:metallophosphoesterase family protein n=1 Tax=Paenibacillus sp. y28 TaxID=3129110 RepID=UPI00301A4C1D
MQRLTKVVTNPAAGYSPSEWPQPGNSRGEFHYMKPFRFIHAADLHLDSPFRGLSGLPQAVRDRVRESTFRALVQLVDLAVKEQVDFIVIAGDVYDLSDRSLRAQLRFQQALQQLARAGIEVFVVHGNHDPEDGRRAELQWPETVHFFPSAQLGQVLVVKPGRGAIAEICGISYATAAVRDNLALKFPQQPGELFRIGLLHTNVDGDHTHDNYAPCRLSDLRGAGIDYWALGHIHSRRVLCERPYAVYPGNLQGRSVKETGAKGAYLVTVTAEGKVELDFHALDAVRWLQRELPVAELQTEQELWDAVAAAQEDALLEAEGRAAVIRITLQGRGPLSPALQRGSLQTELAAELREEQIRKLKLDPEGTFVWLDSLRIDAGLQAEPGHMPEQDAFAGELLRMVRRLMEDPAEFEAFCTEALGPLWSQAKAERQLSGLAAEERERWLAEARELALQALGAEMGWSP